ARAAAGGAGRLCRPAYCKAEERHGSCSGLVWRLCRVRCHRQRTPGGGFTRRTPQTNKTGNRPMGAAGSYFA
ncbi:MAG: hypothetical protein IJL52_00125, partial [Clostridia bacterium]|nr:hypothetical protein [Clostridia bacterium]